VKPTIHFVLFAMNNERGCAYVMAAQSVWTYVANLFEFSVGYSDPWLVIHVYDCLGQLPMLVECTVCLGLLGVIVWLNVQCRGVYNMFLTFNDTE